MAALASRVEGSGMPDSKPTPIDMVAEDAAVEYLIHADLVRARGKVGLQAFELLPQNESVCG